MKLVYYVCAYPKNKEPRVVQGLGDLNNTHFTVTVKDIKDIPEEVYLLYPDEQNNLRSDGVITEGIVFSSEKEFMKMNVEDLKFRDFINATEDYSGCGHHMNVQICIKELLSNGRMELQREFWCFRKIKLPKIEF